MLQTSKSHDFVENEPLTECTIVSNFSCIPWRN